MLNRVEWVVPLFYSSKPRFTHRISNLSHRYSLTNASAVALWCRLSCVSVETSQQCDWGITVAAMTGHSRRRSGRYRPAVLSNRHNHWLHQLEIALSLDTVESDLLCSGQVLGQLGRLSLLWERPRPTPPTRALASQCYTIKTSQPFLVTISCM